MFSNIGLTHKLSYICTTDQCCLIYYLIVYALINEISQRNSIIIALEVTELDFKFAWMTSM